MNAPTPQNSVTDWSEQSTRFESASPVEIVRWAMETFGDKLSFATAFGAEGCTLVDIIARLRDETNITPDIFNLDTGYQFPQTLALKSKLEKKYNLPIRFIRPAETPQQAEARLGGPPCVKEPGECCFKRKVVPLSEALQGFSAYITAVRRDQTPERAGIPIIGYDPRNEIIKNLSAGKLDFGGRVELHSRTRCANESAARTRLYFHRLLAGDASGAKRRRRARWSMG